LLARARVLADAISSRLKHPVRLSVTDNRSTMVSFRRRAFGLAVRAHHMFLDAPASVVDAVADYVGQRAPGASAVIDAYVRQNGSAIRIGEARSQQACLVERGRVWHLGEIFDRLNAAYFGGGIDARIGWGRGAPARRRRTIRLGVYDHLTRTIRVHPALDRREVPGYFVDYIVFHEMLHQAEPGRDRAGRRRQHHSREFRARERTFLGYDRALAWERQNIGLLLGRPAARRLVPVD
jgi:hypothetical protein